MFSTVSEKVSPMHSAVLVIDMQNDFCSRGGAFDKAECDLSMVQGIIPQLKEFIAKSRVAQVPLIFIRLALDSQNQSYLSDVWLSQARRRRGELYWKIPVCTEGTWGWEFHRDLNPEKNDAIVTKHRFSAFLGTALEMILRAKGVRTLILTGAATNVCVESTAREAFQRDYYVVVPRDCVAAYFQKYHDVALEQIDIWYGEVVSAAEIIRYWESPR